MFHSRYVYILVPLTAGEHGNIELRYIRSPCITLFFLLIVCLHENVRHHTRCFWMYLNLQVPLPTNVFNTCYVNSMLLLSSWHLCTFTTPPFFIASSNVECNVVVVSDMMKTKIFFSSFFKLIKNVCSTSQAACTVLLWEKWMHWNWEKKEWKSTKHVKNNDDYKLPLSL